MYNKDMKNLLPTLKVNEQEVLDYLIKEKRGIFDLVLDKPLIESKGLLSPVFVKKMKALDLIQPLQWGRYVVASKEKPTTSPLYYNSEVLPKILLERLKMDYYLSWHSALWHYGLIDQQSSTIFTAIKERKKDFRSNALSVKFVTISSTKFFGFKTVSFLGHKVNMATPEKGLVDCFDHPEFAGPYGVVVNALKEAWDKGLITGEALTKTILQMDSPTLNRRLGFWMERYEIPGSEKLLPYLGRGYAVLLSPGRYQKSELPWKVNRKWRILEDEQIIYTAEHLK
jgi:predicted transcriptional regulator of viral defense system